MACLLLTVAEVFTAISQSTPVCRDAAATNYVSGAPRTHLWQLHSYTTASTRPRYSQGCGAGCAPSTVNSPHSPERLQPTRAHPCVAGDLASDAYEAPWTCTYKIFGCTDPSFDNYVSFATDSLASMCQLGGCNDTAANNFNAGATYNDGTCTYDHFGCMVRHVAPSEGVAAD